MALFVALFLPVCVCARVCVRARARPTHRLQERVLQPPQQPTSAISGTLQRPQLRHQLAAAAQKTTGPRSTTDEVVLAASVRHCINSSLGEARELALRVVCAGPGSGCSVSHRGLALYCSWASLGNQ